MGPGTASSWRFEICVLKTAEAVAGCGVLCAPDAVQKLDEWKQGCVMNKSLWLADVPRTIPHGMTAQRPTWAGLTREVQERVAERCGAHVIAATVCGGGFTPGFAVFVRCDNSLQYFVKAAYADDAEWLRSAYR